MILRATCAPSISQYIKNINATRFVDKFPAAVKAIKENHNVDDLLDSTDNFEEAKTLIEDVTYILRQAGFNIRNWISNAQRALSLKSGSESLAVKCLNKNDNQQVEKVLGVYWDHKDDVITFKIADWILNTDIFSAKKTPTKRELLRFVMSIYDPLGLIGHLLINVKILLQEVWQKSEDIKIPRCYLSSMATYDKVNLQLHTFVDASRDGSSAVCCFRAAKDDVIECCLIGSKTRVAPIKITSVPRLELMAALIGVSDLLTLYNKIIVFLFLRDTFGQTQKLY